MIKNIKHYNVSMTTIRRCLAAAALCTLGLSSCVTLVDSGSMLDDIGKQSPSHRIRLVQEKHNRHRYYEKEEIQVWEKEGLYFVQLPVAYIPARVKNRDYLVGMGMYLSGKVVTFPRQMMRDEEVIQFQHTREYFYAVLSETQLNKATSKYDKYADAFCHETYPVLSASEVDLSNAEKWTPSPSQESELSDNTAYMFKQLADRRTTGNRLRRPLAFLLDIADVPLSIAATPFAWVADFVNVCFSD